MKELGVLFEGARGREARSSGDPRDGAPESSFNQHVAGSAPHRKANKTPNSGLKGRLLAFR
jgi:hypothetical protein